MYMKEMSLSEMATVTGGLFGTAPKEELGEQENGNAQLGSGPWGKAWGEGGWGSGKPNQDALQTGPWGKAWGEGGWGSSAPRKKGPKWKKN